MKSKTRFLDTLIDQYVANLDALAASTNDNMTDDEHESLSQQTEGIFNLILSMPASTPKQAAAQIALAASNMIGITGMVSDLKTMALKEGEDSTLLYLANQISKQVRQARHAVQGALKAFQSLDIASPHLVRLVKEHGS